MTRRGDNRNMVDVVMVEPIGGHGGMDFWNHSMCTSLVEAGWRPLLLTSQGLSEIRESYPVREIYNGVFGKASKCKRGLRHLWATAQGLWLARRQGARVAHFHFFHVGVLQYFGVVFANFLRLKVVVSAHDVGSFRAGESARILSRVYHACHAVIVYSLEGRRAIGAALELPESQIFLAPHGNYDGFLPPLPPTDEAKNSFGFKEADLVLLFFGQLKKIKRLDLLIRATALARERGADRIRLLIAGSIADSDINRIRQIIDEEALNEITCLFPQYVHNQDLPRYFSASDLAVLPYDHIYQSGVVLLAMSNGVPVLTSDIPGMLEVVENDVTGLTFRAGDVHSLADKLVEVERGGVDLRSLACSAQSIASTRHSWRNCARITVNAYQAAENNAEAPAMRGDSTARNGSE